MMTNTITADNLNDLMEFGHVIQVHSDGSVTGPRDVHGPEIVYQELDEDGQCVNDDILDLPADWSLMTGYTRQYSYSRPVMHQSEFIGGRMARDILSTPGYYVAVVVDGLPYDEDENTLDLNIGWAVAFKESEES